jgi:2-aminoethylphosphonate-pyruvate transaminase
MNQPTHLSETPPTLASDRDKLLFTPGPLTTSMSVKQAMLHDAGSWHYEFNAKVAWIRVELLRVAGVSRDQGWETVLLQGSGTFAVESVFATCVPPDGKVAVCANGAYGERAARMLSHAGIAHTVLRVPEHLPMDPALLADALAADPAITHVFAVHCETTSGILNPIGQLGGIAREHAKVFVVDAMSSFGGMSIGLDEIAADYLVFSSNKCLEGVPGVGCVICRRERLLACEGWARSLSLDLVDQLRGFERNGQFRYTPPTHCLLALEQALIELAAEGGVAVRHDRYRRNHEVLLEGMRAMGFRSLLPAQVQSPFITSFHYPRDPRFTFDLFYRALSDCGFIIYPGKISQADLFRIGTIGRIFPSDIRALLAAVRDVCTQLGIDLPPVGETPDMPRCCEIAGTT